MLETAEPRRRIAAAAAVRVIGILVSEIVNAASGAVRACRSPKGGRAGVFGQNYNDSAAGRVLVWKKASVAAAVPTPDPKTSPSEEELPLSAVCCRPVVASPSFDRGGQPTFEPCSSCIDSQAHAQSRCPELPLCSAPSKR